MKLAALDPPGSYIKEELDARGWSQRDLAYILGMAETQLSRILAGNQSVTPDLARQLGEAFEVPAEFFANLQKQYDLSRAKDPDPAIRTRATLQSRYPVREMIRRGWIQDSDPALLELQIARFFEVEDVSDAPRYAMAAKRTHYDEDPPAQVVWLFRVRQIARQIDAPAYSESRLRELAPKLRPLMIDPESAREIPQLLLECGVRLVVVEWLPGSKIDGVCTWLDDQCPVIGLSTLHDRLDNFWFVLRHEIEHVLRGDGKQHAMFDALDGDGASQSSEAAELAANDAAAEFCIPKDRLKSFYSRKYPYISEKDVIGFASVMQVHPAIVVGQLQTLMNRYNYLRKYQVPVRKYLIDGAPVDGFGRVAPINL
jgi:HTH-type transcriptional regulator / antitoxin HigA